MISIKITLLGRTSIFHCFKHLSAVITDEETGEYYLINHPFSHYSHKDKRSLDPDKAMQLYQESVPNCCASTVTLFSDKNYNDLIREFRNEFPQGFKWCTNNCSTAINFILDHAFPNENVINNCYTALQVLCMPLFLVSLASQCFPAPPCIDTPVDVYNKAKLLSYSHGSLTSAQWLAINEARKESDELVVGGRDFGIEYAQTFDEKCLTGPLRQLKMI